MSGKSRPHDGYLAEVVRKAEDSPKFRVALRKESRLIDFLSEEQLRRILAQCRVQCSKAKTADEYKNALKEWLRGLQNQDESITSDHLHSGGKRKPSNLEEGVFPEHGKHQATQEDNRD